MGFDRDDGFIGLFANSSCELQLRDKKHQAHKKTA
jgi:hypothetical protein